MINILEDQYKCYKEQPLEQREEVISDFIKLLTNDYTNRNQTVNDALNVVKKQRNSIHELQQEIITLRNYHSTVIYEL